MFINILNEISMLSATNWYYCYQIFIKNIYEYNEWIQLVVCYLLILQLSNIYYYKMLKIYWMELVGCLLPTEINVNKYLLKLFMNILNGFS